MKLQFRHQPFQADAAKAVCDVFAGQPFRTPTYMIDSGMGQLSLSQTHDYTGFSIAPIVVSDDKILVGAGDGSVLGIVPDTAAFTFQGGPS